MTKEMEVKGGAAAAVAVAADVEASEEESLLMEGMAVLDFDMLCSTVAMQAHKGKWGKLNDDNEEENLVSAYQNGGVVFRMWEGEIIYDCFDDRLVALQSTCCPCYSFGKNMKRAGYGSCFLQDFSSLSSTIGAGIYSLYSCSCSPVQPASIYIYSATLLSIFGHLFTVSVGTYIGFYRTLIRKRFNIKGSESSFEDCVYHLICPCCTLSQESRTLEMNNVQDGIWHGRGDAICIGTVSTKLPECLGMQKDSNDS